MDRVVQVLDLSYDHDGLHFVAVVGIVLAASWFLIYILSRPYWSDSEVISAGMLTLCMASFAMAGSSWSEMRIIGPLAALAMFGVAMFVTLTSSAVRAWRTRRSRS